MTMRRFIILSVTVLANCALCGAGGRDSLFIDGEWTACAVPSDTEKAVGYAVNASDGVVDGRRVLLPGSADENRLGARNPDTLNTSGLTRLCPFEGRAVYSRKVRIPRSFAHRRLRLVLERTKPSTLYVDEDSVGTLGNILSPQVYELPAISPGSHVISLAVDNSPSAVPSGIHSSHAWSDATQTNWNGVIGKMFIESADSVFISSVKISPSVADGTAEVEMRIVSHRDIPDAVISVTATPEPAEGVAAVRPSEGVASTEAAEDRLCLKALVRRDLVKGLNVVSVTVDMGESPLLWSEFHPHLYRFDVSVEADGHSDSVTERAGMRDFSVSGTSFTINGFKTFLRGKHDACVFPLTGYPPASVDEWRQVFATARQYGINHYRFHSWTPPEAAFEAADLEGMYLQVELPLWGEVSRNNVALNDFLLREAKLILEEYGNHPSFVMMSLGNELYGDVALMGEWTEMLREADGRPLYCFGSNNFLGWNGAQPGEDFFVACRVGWGEGFSSHVRTTFAFADADGGGILNSVRPGTEADYSAAVSASPVPVISHENCQFQSYPDFSQIERYTGVLYPYNLEVFRRRLADAGMEGYDGVFSRASGEFAVECFKADLEYALRTPGFGGFQMLDLQDYPGQGTALVGVLDAFMESKGAVTPKRFREFCAPVVALAEFESHCLTRRDTLEVALLISNYCEHDWTAPLRWSLSALPQAGCSAAVLGDGCRGAAFGGRDLVSGEVRAQVPLGDVMTVGHISVPLEKVTAGLPQDAALSLLLRLESGDCSNSYRFWAYPTAETLAASGKPAESVALDEFSASVGTSASEPVDSAEAPSGLEADVAVVTAADDSLKSLLSEGRTVLLIPEHSEVEGSTLGGMFIPDFWNWSMFKTISENAGKEVSPGTFSVICDPGHPAFALFPNDGRSDWQWWSVTRNSRPLILDELDRYFPVLQMIDNPERCHRLGILAEFAVGNGRLMVCMTDLDAIADTPEGAAFRASVLRYVASEDFRPSYRLEWSELQKLLYGRRESVDIEGVRNQTDYSRFAEN